MRALIELPRAWWSIELPGYRNHPKEYRTYSNFAFHELPPIERELDDQFGWLRNEPVLPLSHSLAEVDEVAQRPATRDQLEQLLAGQPVALPRSFMTFIASDEPRPRIRSCTACYLDLADFAIPVSSGGMLIHFLSDQQWVLHWLLYCGSGGSEAVVVSERPLGFELAGLAGCGSPKH